MTPKEEDELWGWYQGQELEKWYKEIKANQKAHEVELKRWNSFYDKYGGTIEAVDADLARMKTAAEKEVTSMEQTIKRLEREIDLLNKELAKLKKEALSGADMKALSDRIKKLEAGR